ncbi:ketopantoate reductase family protein [Pseudocolwellia sp. HL-MZ19]|uniref:ketopantoate reductase family protein n=1 Tax=unclassified Pseudocolwellia TaxID=2848178 RepID=UPI003CF667EC
MKVDNNAMNKQKTNVLIVGSGAIGLLWYSHFALNSKHSINCYLYQSAKRKALPDEIKFTNINDTTHVIHSNIITQPKSPMDIVLVCVKSYQLNQAIADIQSIICPKTLVITTHNGLGALNTQSNQYLENNIVLNMLTTHGCLKVADNEIKHTGAGISHLGVKFDVAEKYLESNKQKDIRDLLHTILPEVVWCDDILSKQWLKLAINCVINPLTAVFDIKNGEVINPEFTSIIEQVIDEVVAIGQAKGISLDKVQLIETVLLVAQATANNSSSMRCDAQQKRETEIEYINGYIHKSGQELNIPTPKNTELYQKVLALTF